MIYDDKKPINIKKYIHGYSEKQKDAEVLVNNAIRKIEKRHGNENDWIEHYSDGQKYPQKKTKTGIFYDVSKDKDFIDKLVEEDKKKKRLRERKHVKLQSKKPVKKSAIDKLAAGIKSIVVPTNFNLKKRKVKK